MVAKEVKLMAIHKGIRIHQYLDDWLVRARSHQICLQHTQILVKMCQDLGWLVNVEKSELEPKQVFNFVGYQFDLKSGRVRPTPDRWQNLQNKILERTALRNDLSGPGVHVIDRFINSHRKTGSFRTSPHETNTMASEKQLESTGIPRKGDPDPQVLTPTFAIVLEEKNILTGQPLHPLKHALQNFTDASKEGWGAHLNECTARGTWSLPESKLHINYLELKAVFLALKEFQDLWSDKIVLIATDNTTVVSYINKEGGMRSGTLCALL